MKLPSLLMQWLQQRQTSLCHRQLLVISGNEDWAKLTATTLVNQQKDQSTLWVGDGSASFETIKIKDYRAKLGQEYDCLIFNCFSGFRASAAMALSGTITAQGCMFLICPELADWTNYPDPEHSNRTSYGFNQSPGPSRFIHYLISRFNQDNCVAVLTEKHFSGDVSNLTVSSKHDLYAEQKQAVSHVCKVAQGRNNRPFVLTADRGRGKSSALGIAAANLMHTPGTSVWLTAPTIRNVEQVFSHCSRLLPKAKFDKNNIHFDSSILAFKPVDQLLLSQTTLPNILIVDEASAIPVNILIKLSQKYTRIVFSSTVHGYEGSGRGFEVKFKQLLLDVRPQFKSLHMTQPIRWHNNDVLEQFWFKTLFYQSTYSAPKMAVLDGQVENKVLGQNELLANTPILAQVFSLLLDAHYQTSPDDLQRLLDAPEVKCFVTLKNQKVIAVAQIIEEGGEPLSHIAELIAANNKRVKGHLVAQNIASSYYQADFCQAKQWRVSRIAVSPSLQRKGLASQLLTFVEEQALLANVNFLTAAFGANPALLTFWHQLRYSPVKISLKPEVSSGEHSCIHLKLLTSSHSKLTQEITAEFAMDLIFNMDKALKNLNWQVLLELLINNERPKLTNSHKNIIKQFINNNRRLSSCKRLVTDALLSQLEDIKQLSDNEQGFLISLLLQNRSYQEISLLYKLSGKKQIEQKVQSLLNVLFLNAQ